MILTVVTRCTCSFFLLADLQLFLTCILAIVLVSAYVRFLKRLLDNIKEKFQVYEKESYLVIIIC